MLHKSYETLKRTQEQVIVPSSAVRCVVVSCLRTTVPNLTIGKSSLEGFVSSGVSPFSRLWNDLHQRITNLDYVQMVETL